MSSALGLGSIDGLRRRAAKTLKRERQHQKTNSEEYNVLGTQLVPPRFAADLKALFAEDNPGWRALHSDDVHEATGCLAFRLLCKGAAGAHLLLESVHRQPWAKLFRLLIDDEREKIKEELGQLRRKPCCMDRFTKTFLERYPQERVTSDEALALLRTIAALLWNNISKIENRHAQLRRFLVQRVTGWTLSQAAATALQASAQLRSLSRGALPLPEGQQKKKPRRRKLTLWEAKALKRGTVSKRQLRNASRGWTRSPAPWGWSYKVFIRMMQKGKGFPDAARNAELGALWRAADPDVKEQCAREGAAARHVLATTGRRAFAAPHPYLPPTHRRWLFQTRAFAWQCWRRTFRTPPSAAARGTGGSLPPVTQHRGKASLSAHPRRWGHQLHS